MNNLFFFSFQVLLTSSDAILANLTPALVAEANMLRERVAHRYSRTLFGMYPRGRRGETSRRGESIGSALDGAGGGISSRKSDGAKLVEADGAPLVDTEALHSLIRLFRIVQVSIYGKQWCWKICCLLMLIYCSKFYCSHSIKVNCKGFF